MQIYTVDYILSNRITLADYYPYVEKQAATCRSVDYFAPNITKQAFYYPHANETLLKKIVSRDGPAVVVISVNEAFVAYKSGIMNTGFQSGCNGLKHAVVVVGQLKSF